MASRGRKVKDRILELLREHPEGLRQADIARALGVSRSYVSEVVNELLRKGIVKKIREHGITKIVYSTQPIENHVNIVRLGIVWSSEYPFITYFAKKLRERGYWLDVIVYSNALDATLDVVTGKIDLVLSPLVTQFLYASMTNRLRIIGGGAVGGASVIENPWARDDKAVSSKASTMDLLITLVLSEEGIPLENKMYCGSGEEIMYMIASGRAKYAAIWEPLATKLKKMGYKEIISLKDLDIPHCCTLAISTLTKLDIELVKKAYSESLEEYIRKPDQAIEWYSIKTGIPVQILKESTRNYRYTLDIEHEKTISVLRKAGITIPEPGNLKKYIVA